MPALDHGSAYVTVIKQLAAGPVIRGFILNKETTIKKLSLCEEDDYKTLNVKHFD